MKTKYFLMSAIIMGITAIAMLIYIPTVKADTGIEHAKVYDDEYINEIKNGDNSLTKTERETLVKAYNRINELQSEIDSIYDNIEDLNIKAERIVDTKYIEDELKKNGIKFMKLVGQTRVDTRMDLVNKFNEDEDIKVFLISLKAGGTGLNLISADMVIHYDPWWNLSAENQATDRTYRIGQKRNVQVYKLITKNSIEEKIYNLQEKKAKLVNDMLSTNEVFLNRLSKDEIMNLFE